MPDFQSSQALKDFYLKLSKDITKNINILEPDISIKNKIHSYLVSLLKGHQNRRQIPKAIPKKIARELRFLAYDRNFHECVAPIEQERIKGMQLAADQINKQRQNRGDYSGQIQRLVNLARQHYLDRENAPRIQGDQGL